MPEDLSAARSPAVNQSATQVMADWVHQTLHSGEPAFDVARQIANRLGAQKSGDTCEFLFWAPELLELRIPDGDIFIEILERDGDLDLARARQSSHFRRTRLPVQRVEAWCLCAVDGLTAGTRDTLGSFYALVWRDSDNRWSRINDPLAASLPFGPFAPAEYYDMEALQAARRDQAYYAALPKGKVHKFGPATSILQVHVPTATASRSIAGLTRQIETLAERVRSGAELDPSERIFLGYDAIQLLPVEPTTVYEAGPSFWTETDDQNDRLEVDLRRPDSTNWGYDVVISGMAAVNPSLLETARPDELVDLAAALHLFPGQPKKLIFDVVFGHSDNQGLEALNHHYFAGPNMYGQNLNYRHPVVRAILLEMQRRKVNFGADGVRVDGAQDFKWWDSC